MSKIPRDLCHDGTYVVRDRAQNDNHESVPSPVRWNRMTTEFELDCTACGTRLARRTVEGKQVGLPEAADLEIAECPNCGGRYFPESTLERLD